MSQQAIEALLKHKTGLDASLLGPGAIATAMQKRMAAHGVVDLPTYVGYLQTSAEELTAFLEHVVVPETWFFRDREPFIFLSRYVLTEWLPAHPHQRLRVLSAPCSTGEEPYSIAIALIEAGLSAESFQIDAIDISQQALQVAQQAIYGVNSFRGGNLGFRDRHFRQVGPEYHLHPLISACVRFRHGNLLEPGFLGDRGTYDVVFCRNVLIYFDRPARERTVQVLERLLTAQGVLFVGHAEAGQLLNSRFMPIRHPLAFAYRKVDVARSLEVRQRSLTTPNLNQPPPLTIAPKSSPAPQPTSKPPPKTPQVPRQSSSPDDLLETAKTLANQGRLQEASQLCQLYLNQNRMSAEAYVLLGQVQQAMGSQELAEQAFHKAIYLEPNYEEALIHLALLKQQGGDTAGATVIWQRVQRLQKPPTA